MAGLWDAPGRGDKPRWQVADLEYLEQALEQEQRTYNSQQLSEKLAQDRQVQLSADRIRRLLKKDWRWKRTRHSHRHKQDPVAKAIKQADLDLLTRTAQTGQIVLKYLDESGFSLWSPVSYSYSRIGEQKRLEQTEKRWGRRISILGLWQPGEHFEYCLSSTRIQESKLP